MNKEERKALLNVFQEHLNHVSNLQFGNYPLAEILCHRTKDYASTHFPAKFYYLHEVIKLDFRSPNPVYQSEQEAWTIGYDRLLSISHSLLEEAKLLNLEQTLGHKKIAVAGTYLVVATYFLWSFNIWLEWSWLKLHPNRISIYLLFQAIIIQISCLILTRDRRGLFIEWLGLITTCALLAISGIT